MTRNYRSPMTAVLGLSVLLIVLLWPGAGVCADFVPVTISYQEGVIIDTNNNSQPDDADYRWIMTYKPGTPASPNSWNAVVWQRTEDGSDTRVERPFYLRVLDIQGPVVVEEQRWHTHGLQATATSEGTGNTTGYNTVNFTDFFDGSSICKLNLFDTKNDGLGDTIQGYGDVKGVPRLCVDYGLAETAIQTYGGVTYFMMDLSNLPIQPKLHGYKELGDPTIPFSKVFIPVVVPREPTEIPYVTVESNGTLWGGDNARITPATPSPYQMPCNPSGSAHPVPTIDEWGAVLIMLLLFGAGIWTMRKRGFGDKMALR